MTIHNDLKTILVLAPHTDDGELGCGGLIAASTEKGISVHYAAFSNAYISLPPGMAEDTLLREVEAATCCLGIPGENLHVFDFPTRSFPQHRQEILDAMIRLRSSVDPDLILAPSTTDVHQDHSTVCQEAIRCFKKKSILCYEEPWNNITFSTNCFIHLEERHLQKKIDALNCYQSQGHRTYLSEDAIRALALTRGTQLEGGYAEAFEVLRWML